MRRIRAVTGVEHKLPGGRRQRIGPYGARSHDKAERVMQGRTLEGDLAFVLLHQGGPPHQSTFKPIAELD